MSRLYDRSFAVALVSQMGFVLANTLMAHYARWIAFLGGGVRDVGWIMGAGSIVGLLLRPWTGQWITLLGNEDFRFFPAFLAGNFVDWHDYFLSPDFVSLFRSPHTCW